MLNDVEKRHKHRVLLSILHVYSVVCRPGKFLTSPGCIHVVATYFVTQFATHPKLPRCFPETEREGAPRVWPSLPGGLHGSTECYSTT